MSDDISIVLKKLDIITRHIERVKDACGLLGRRLIEKGEISLGIKLIANGYLHDNSKLTSFIEWNYLLQKEDKSLLELAIKQHQSVNSHHPQFWGNIDKMDDVSIAELCADLFSRASEAGSSVHDFLEEYYFPKHEVKRNSYIHKKIKFYISLLTDKFETVEMAKS